MGGNGFRRLPSEFSTRTELRTDAMEDIEQQYIIGEGFELHIHRLQPGVVGFESLSVPSMERRGSGPNLNVLPMFSEEFLARRRRMSSSFELEAEVSASRAIPTTSFPIPNPVAIRGGLPNVQSGVFTGSSSQQASGSTHPQGFVTLSQPASFPVPHTAAATVSPARVTVMNSKDAGPSNPPIRVPASNSQTAVTAIPLFERGLQILRCKRAPVSRTLKCFFTQMTKRMSTAMIQSTRHLLQVFSS
ncbi:hypothetical protein R1sor_018262 [Riccia sorocarpa]|uniref:Uncharacterized protein n=1 Tax=Riccia sorocarpa TaxID=122646 RepID=A0ABD3ICS0_9MARC